MTPTEWKQARHSLGLTLDQLAQVMGCALSTVQGYEAPEGSAKHRKPDGRALRVLEWLQGGFRPPEWPQG